MRLQERLEERRAEIESAVLARVYGVSDPAKVGDPQYVEGLKRAVAAATSYGIEGISSSPDRIAPIPTELLAQARQAARAKVSLDTVLRRYFAGYALIADFVVQEAEAGEFPACELQRALRSEAALFDRLVAAVSEEYGREEEGRSRTTEERRAELVRMLLDGEPIDPAGLGYQLDCWHIGVVAAGSGARSAIGDLAVVLDRRLLAVRTDAGALWAWLGGKRRLASREALRLAESCWPRGFPLSLGESGQGIEGWRLTHKQARAAMSVVLRGEPEIVAYAEVALLASALGDEVLASSLRENYLAPLEQERDGGQALRETLHAYFAAGRNTSSAASSLGVSRQTVTIRLRSVERTIGRTLADCAPELETALRLRELADVPSATS